MVGSGVCVRVCVCVFVCVCGLLLAQCASTSKKQSGQKNPSLIGQSALAAYWPPPDLNRPVSTLVPYGLHLTLIDRALPPTLFTSQKTILHGLFVRRGERGLCGEKKKKNVQIKTTVIHRMNTFALYVGKMRLRNANLTGGAKTIKMYKGRRTLYKRTYTNKPDWLPSTASALFIVVGQSALAAYWPPPDLNRPGASPKCGPTRAQGARGGEDLLE